MPIGLCFIYVLGLLFRDDNNKWKPFTNLVEIYQAWNMYVHLINRYKIDKLTGTSMFSGSK